MTPPGTENPTIVDVGRAFFPVDIVSSFFKSEAQDFFTAGTAGIGGAGGLSSASVASSRGGSTAGGISAGTAVEGVEGDFTSEEDALDIEV